jgi:hypothetical protein
MKSMSRIAPTAAKARRKHKRLQEAQRLLDEFIDDTMKRIPSAERELLVDLSLTLRNPEEEGKGDDKH